jgi:adenylate cyclase
MEPPTQNLTILFADVTGSTRLYETLGDREALETIGRCLEIIRLACEGRGGRVLKTVGDGSMAAFPFPANAAYASIAMHTQIAMQRTREGEPLSIHVGFHHGPVLGGETDVFGDTVNVAARLSELAKAGQTLVSAQTVEVLSPALRSRTRAQNLQTVTGKQADMVLWQESSDELTTMSLPRATRPAHLHLSHGGRSLVLDEKSPVFVIGRDAASDLVVADRMASRLHAHIERRHGKFVLVDVSSNGTYCTVDGEPEEQLHREELVLRGRGRISFGQPAAVDPAGCLEYDCRD